MYFVRCGGEEKWRNKNCLCCFPVWIVVPLMEIENTREDLDTWVEGEGQGNEVHLDMLSLSCPWHNSYADVQHATDHLDSLDECSANIYSSCPPTVGRIYLYAPLMLVNLG